MLCWRRSRQGSKRRRKGPAKVNSPPKLKVKAAKEGGKEARSASYTSLATAEPDQPRPADPRSHRACLSSSPCPARDGATVSAQVSDAAASTATAGAAGSKSPAILFSGSSTLPRSISETRRLETDGAGAGAGRASVLTLQLEGAFGCSMSVSETGSREDTISPMVSQKTGQGIY